jgi:DNA-binding CsgD family transcriptional regulator
MAPPLAVTERDLHALRDVVDPLNQDTDDGPGLPWSVMSGMEALIPAESMTFNLMDPRGSRTDFEQSLQPGAEDDPEESDAFWSHFWASDCSYADRTGDFRRITTTTDFGSLSKAHQSPLHRDYLAPDGLSHTLMACVPLDEGRSLRLIYFRGFGDPLFSERDRDLLLLLRPHIFDAYLGVQRRRRGVPHLTPRQWQLMRLVDSGLGNRQIARRLGVSENTVRKHLENIYARLGVTSRTAAVAAAFPDRLLTVVA